MKVFFRRQVYSNSSTGLEKSAQGVWNTPPSPPLVINRDLFNTVKVLVGKEVFTLEKILSSRRGQLRGQLQCDKEIEDRVRLKI